MANRDTIHETLENARRELLDSSNRNRLVSTPRSSTRSSRLEIIDERSDEIFRILVRENKAMTFLPVEKPESTEETGEDWGLLYQPEEDCNETDRLAARHTDSRLQTPLTSKALQRRLLKLFYDARTFEEEQGINILYLALGYLRWYEDEDSDRERYAPLLLVPVELDRRSANSRFRLQFTGDEIGTNLSLQQKLKADFGIRLPEVPDIEDLSPMDYFTEVAKAVSAKPRWKVQPNDMVLWFFSFSNFLMYRDLLPETWPDQRPIEDHRLVSGLLQSGFGGEPDIWAEDEKIDRRLHPLDMIHVMDADSSQAVAIDEVKQGRDLVIQGPPGTGKSQTIANLIATAVKDGKTVLFVAEKMAALEVVKRRLDEIDLGDMCLELHSRKTNKRLVLQELSRTMQLRRPNVGDVTDQAEQLKLHREALNRHAEVIHTYLEPARVTPFQAIGELVRLTSSDVKSADFDLLDPLTWTATQVREKQSLLRDLVSHVRRIGNPQQHVWRGVCLEIALPSDVDRIVSAIPDVLARLDRLIAATGELADLLSYGTANTLRDSLMVAQFGQKLVAAPSMDRSSLINEVWDDRRHDIVALVETGKVLTECQKKLHGTVVDVGWTTSVGQARRNLAAYGRSWFRFFYPEYRQAQATLRGILNGPPLNDLDQRLLILDDLLRGQRALQSVEFDARNQSFGRRAFGDRWQGAKSDWPALEKIVAWETECRAAKLPDNFRRVAAKLEDHAEAEELVGRIRRDLNPLFREVKQLFKQLKLDLLLAFGKRDLGTVSLRKLRARLKAWQSSREELTLWIAYSNRWRKLEPHGIGALAKQIDQGQVVADDVLVRFEIAYYESLMHHAYDRFPNLAEFDGISHDDVLQKFKALDFERLIMARQEVAMAHYQGLPGNKGGIGELGILRRQIQLQRRHMPLRKLLREAGHAVQAIKPVLMMSPISVAQYLEPGVLEFDLLLIDEASQVRPSDALGAVARSKQMVVVGDERQLPPTNIFRRFTGDDGDDNRSDGFQVGDVESILGLCEAQSLPRRMLDWHYRSRHHSLIVVSNREFYENKLHVIPSPYGGDGDLGVRFHHVPEGIFDRGRSATNRIEAQAVAKAVMRHAREYREKTLGVAAFSVAQRDAILDEIEIRRREAPDLEPFFFSAKAEPFFVKNLENIQGDQRDVIFISVGYAKDDSGRPMPMNFGPLNKEGGQRRLNVLISRACERCEVFSSITADDIDLNKTNAWGARALKTYLTYAATGQLDIATPTGREHDSEFERQVARAITAQGYQVVPQVGEAGFFIDLAIVDPDHNGRYLLAIECDGASYHSSRSARDRDRLRQEVLEDRGWIIHRIWSTDWFQRPQKQLKKCIEAIERAKITWSGRSNAGNSISKLPTGRTSQSIIERDHNRNIDEVECRASITASSYDEADFSVDTRRSLHELRTSDLAKVARRVVVLEGPVHREEIARRLASLWGHRRVGSRIARAVDAALENAVFQRQLCQSGSFFQTTDQRTVSIRNRENVRSASLRKPDYLPPIEIQAAVMAIVRDHFGVPTDQVVTGVARLFGFSATSAQLRQVIKNEISLALEQNILEQRNEKLYDTTPTEASS